MILTMFKFKKEKKLKKSESQGFFLYFLADFKMFLPREMTAVVYEAMEKTAESFYMLMLFQYLVPSFENMSQENVCMEVQK